MNLHKNKSKTAFKILIFSVFILLFFPSCHSSFFNLDIKNDGAVAWNSDSSAFVFVARISMYGRPSGISKFPDGGKVKNKYLDFPVYYFDVRKKHLKKLVSLKEYYAGSSYRWLSIKQVHLCLRDSILFYRLADPYDKIDGKRYPALKEAIGKTFAVNVESLGESVADSANDFCFSKTSSGKFGKSDEANYLKNTKLSDWGIDIEKLSGQSGEKFKEYIIGKKGNTLMREAVFQQIVPHFDKKDRDDILRGMEKRKDELFHKYNKFDAVHDPYRRSMGKRKYEDYILYMEDVKNELSDY